MRSNVYYLYSSDRALEYCGDDAVVDLHKSLAPNRFVFVTVQRFVQAVLIGCQPFFSSQYSIKASDKKVGCIYISSCNFYRTEFVGGYYREVTIEVFERYRGNGYATSAIRSLLLVEKSLIALVRTNNAASNAIFLKIFGQPVAVVSRVDGFFGAKYVIARRLVP